MAIDSNFVAEHPCGKKRPAAQMPGISHDRKSLPKAVEGMKAFWEGGRLGGRPGGVGSQCLVYLASAGGIRREYQSSLEELGVSRVVCVGVSGMVSQPPGGSGSEVSFTSTAQKKASLPQLALDVLKTWIKEGSSSGRWRDSTLG